MRSSFSDLLLSSDLTIYSFTSGFKGWNCVMDGLQNEIRKHAHGKESTKALINCLEQAERSQVLTSAAAAELLRVIDPVANSVAYLYCLDKLKLGKNDVADFVDRASRFLMVCDHSQIRSAPEKFASVCHKLQDQSLQLNRPRDAILPLRTAIGKLAPTSSYFTPIHADLFLVCIKAKCYNARTARPVG
eukprot:jgi/Botrbrau1/18517/Bobra.0072s0092.1